MLCNTVVVQASFFVPRILLTPGTVTLRAPTIWGPESPASLLVAPAHLLFPLVTWFWLSTAQAGRLSGLLATTSDHLPQSLLLRLTCTGCYFSAMAVRSSENSAVSAAIVDFSSSIRAACFL